MSTARTRTRQLVPFAIAAALLWLPPGADAIDIAGSWTLYVPGGSGTAAFTQTGSSVTGTVEGNDYAGTIDPQTGEFSIGHVVGVTMGCVLLNGVVRADSNFLSGTHLFSQNCFFVDSVTPLRGCRNGTGLDCCGDAIVGTTETCDQGPEPETACCDLTCQTKPAGTACTADTEACTTDACDASGTCTHTVGDGDGDGTCDAVDACTSGPPLDRAHLKLRGLSSPEANDRLDLRGTAELPAPPAGLDPPQNGMRILITDATGMAVIDVLLPAGTAPSPTDPGWVAGSSGRSFRYRLPNAPGVRRFQVRWAAATPESITIRASATGLQVPSASITLPLRATLVLGSTTSGPPCAKALFAGSPQAPACTYVGGGDAIVCE